jgi:hypothetical protein
MDLLQRKNGNHGSSSTKPSTLIAEQMLIDVALKKAKSTVKDINKVLLVGGHTNSAGRPRLNWVCSECVNVDECVASVRHSFRPDDDGKFSGRAPGITRGLHDVKLATSATTATEPFAFVDEQTGKHVVPVRFCSGKHAASLFGAPDVLYHGGQSDPVADSHHAGRG